MQNLNVQVPLCRPAALSLVEYSVGRARTPTPGVTQVIQGLHWYIEELKGRGPDCSFGQIVICPHEGWRFSLLIFDLHIPQANSDTHSFDLWRR